MDEVEMNGTNSSAAGAVFVAAVVVAWFSPVHSSSNSSSSSASTKRKVDDADHASPQPEQLTAAAEGCSISTKRSKHADDQSESSAFAASQEEVCPTKCSAAPEAPTAAAAPEDPTDNVRVPPAARHLLREGTTAAPAPAPGATQAQVKDGPEEEAAHKSAEAIQKEVRELLEGTLMATGEDAVKVAALRTLAGYFQYNGKGVKDPAYQQLRPYRDAVAKWHGCHLVLVVLRQELAKADSPNREIALWAVQFLTLWNRKAKRRESMALFNGGDTILGAMHAFPNDEGMQDWTLACLVNYTLDKDAKGRRDNLVNENAIFHIFRAMPTHPHSKNVQRYSLRILGRLCDVAEDARHLGGLVQMGALEALVNAYKALEDVDDDAHQRQRIVATCRKWMTKLVV
jgi:hypothetical protein